MAGGGGGESNADNPLPLNVVPLIDVIFCLLLFFMCSFHFKQLEGKMEAWLPTDKGMNNNAKPQSENLTEIRIVLQYDKGEGRVKRLFGRSEYADDEELGKLMKRQFDSNKANSGKEAPVIIQPEADVSWESVVRVMDIVRLQELPKMEFSLAKTDFKIPDK